MGTGTGNTKYKAREGRRGRGSLDEENGQDHAGGHDHEERRGPARETAVGDGFAPITATAVVIAQGGEHPAPGADHLVHDVERRSQISHDEREHKHAH